MKIRFILSTLCLVFMGLAASADVLKIQQTTMDGTGDGAGTGTPKILYHCFDVTKNISVVVSKAWPDYQNLSLAIWTEVPLTFIHDKNVSLIPGEMPGAPLRVKGDRFELSISMSATGSDLGMVTSPAELTDSLRKDLWYPPKSLALKCVADPI